MGYAMLPSDDDSWHIYRTLDDPILTHNIKCPCAQCPTRKNLDNDYGLSTYDIRLSPSGDELRVALAVEHGHYMRPAGCDYDWLDTLAQLSAVLDPIVYAASAITGHRIVCPVCRSRSSH